MKSYYDIFPAAATPVVTLEVARKTGSIPKGSYAFYECYCTEPSCDCRQVTVLVLNEKRKRKASIRFGFDGVGPCAGPYLDPACYQAPYAAALLEFFVHSLNGTPEWLTRMYRQYREVRELVDGEPYGGTPLPEPGTVRYRALPAPELADFLEASLGPQSRRAGGTPSAGTGRDAMLRLVDLYAKAGGRATVGVLLALQDEVRRYLSRHPSAAGCLAEILPQLCSRSPEEGEAVEAALTLLGDVIDYLQVEVEGGRLGALRHMESFQRALYRCIFLESEDLDLRMAVSDLLLRRRIEVLPELARARARMLDGGEARSDLLHVEGEEVLPAIAAHFEKLRLSSPFDCAQELIQLFVVNGQELQAALTGEMLVSEDALLREVAALMLFHQDPELSLETSRMLSLVEGEKIAPDTLRRLIVSRNWFGADTRRNIDLAVSNARKARVPCGRLTPAASMELYLLADGDGAEEFKVIVPEGDLFYVCSILLREGGGVADAFVLPLDSRADVDALLAQVKDEQGYAETTVERLDQSVCHALYQGAARGVSPCLWLARIAELLGRDSWMAVSRGR